MTLAVVPEATRPIGYGVVETQAADVSEGRTGSAAGCRTQLGQRGSPRIESFDLTPPSSAQVVRLTLAPASVEGSDYPINHCLENILSRMTSTVSTRVFVVQHNPNSGRYRYPADPTDAVASARALVAAGEGTWVAGNCRRMIRAGDLLLFKFGGARLKQPAGIYAAGRVTRSPIRDHRGVWVLRYGPDGRLTQRLLRQPIEGKALVSVTKRSFGASIQAVEPRRYPILGRLLGDARLLAQDQDGREQITHGLLILKEPLDKILQVEDVGDPRQAHDAPWSYRPH